MEKLRAYLAEREMSLPDFAKESGIPLPTIWRILRRPGYDPRISMLVRIKKATGGAVTPDDFICDVE